MRHILIILTLVITSTMFALGDTSEDSNRLVVHLLDYLAKDYTVAVKNGKVINNLEYDEQIEFINLVRKTSLESSVIKNNNEIQTEITTLKNLIINKRSEKKVASLARRLQSKIIQLSNFNISPSRWPNLANGERIYSQDCMACHGATGNGKGPKVTYEMDPKPTNFLNEDAMKEISPFQAFNTIRLGVPGTAMPEYDYLSDSDVWDLAFYVVSLRHGNFANNKNVQPDFAMAQNSLGEKLLVKVAKFSDVQLESFLGKQENKDKHLIALRTYSNDGDSNNFLGIARKHLNRSIEAYKKRNFKLAKAEAVNAYLEGIEPIEPRLKANDQKVFEEIETKMSLVRSAIAGRGPLKEVATSIQAAHQIINKIETVLQDKKLSPWLAFLTASAILLREGFEAILIILALLAVIRATKSEKAARWVHGGWILALASGGIAWIFSGWLMTFSGAKRELMEAATSLFAVGVLLYVGFWLHRQTQVKRWRLFIDGKVKTLLQRRNLLGLAVISFIAVFREVFETVLFLRAVWLEGGVDSKMAMAAGVWISLFAVIGIAWLMLKYSVRIPIKKLFNFSSWIMAVLATVLTGKGLHSLQETGVLSVTGTSLNFRSDILGLYPTLETVLPQILVFGVIILVFIFENKSTSKPLLKV